MSQFTPLGSVEAPSPLSLPGLGPAPNEHEIPRLWRGFLRRKRLFIGIVVTFVLFVALITLMTPKTYTTTVRLMSGTPGASTPSSSDTTTLPILNALVLQDGAQTAETFAALIQQQNIADAVVKNLGLNSTASKVLAQVTVKPVVNTAILELSVKWPHAEDSARIANEFGKVFVDVQRGFVQSQANAALGFLAAELPSAEKRMNAANAELANYQAANGFIDVSDHTKDIVARDSAVQERIETLTLDLQGAQTLYNNLHGELGTMPAATNPVEGGLKQRLAEVEAQLAIARKQYTEQHPAVIALIQQEDALRNQIALQPSEERSGEAVVNPNPVYQTLSQEEAADRARIQGDTENLAQLQTVHKSLAATMKQLPEKGMMLTQLQQRAKLATDVYQALQQKYTDATIARTTAISDVSIIQPASADAAVLSPNLKLNLMVAPLIGMLIASIVVFILEYFERKLRDANDVQSAIGLPVIASVPSFSSSSRRALPWLQSMTVEAFLHLCVSLRLSKRQPLHSLAITSACIGDGKSTVAFNLAKALSNVQPPILLIDGDMRRSTLHSHAGTPNLTGLSEVLNGESELLRSVQKLSPQLDLLTSGQPVPNPVALLQSTHFDDLLEEAKRHYSIVVIDTPALSCVADGFAIASRVDGTALVVAANTTDERVAKEVVSQFQALGIDNVVGVVLNKDRQRIHDYSDYFAGAFTNALPKGTD